MRSREPGKISLSDIYVSSREFELSHGKRPSGRGYWAFRIGSAREPFWIAGDLPYSEAKKRALQEAQRRGSYEISVCP